MYIRWYQFPLLLSCAVWDSCVVVYGGEGLTEQATVDVGTLQVIDTEVRGLLVMDTAPVYADEIH